MDDNMQRKLIINDFYKSINVNEINTKININIKLVKITVDVLVLIYLSQNILFHIIVNIILVSILLLNITYVIISLINIKFYKNYLDFNSIKYINNTKLINKYSAMSAAQFDTVWGVTVQGYATGKYRINNLDEKAFRKIRNVNKIYFGILKNNDILVLDENIEILVNEKKFLLIDYLKTQKIEVREEVIKEVLDIQDIKKKVQDRIQINIINFGIYKTIYFCYKLSYFIIWIVICKMFIF